MQRIPAEHLFGAAREPTHLSPQIDIMAPRVYLQGVPSLPSAFQTQARAQRERTGLKLTEVAQMIGISRQALHAIETGATIPGTHTALYLARVLGCTVEDLFSLSEPVLPVRLMGDVPLPARARLAHLQGEWLAFPTQGQHGFMEAADGLATHGPDGTTSIQLFGDLDAARRTAVLAGCDPAFALLATHATRQPGGRVLLHPLSSRAALRALAQGEAHAAGIHLFDAPSGQSNLPFVERDLPGRDLHLYTLWNWEQGLLVAPGNPKGIQGVRDLLRPDVRLQNREPDAGSRVLLDTWLDAAQVSLTERRAIHGYADEVHSPLDAAQRIATGDADVAPGPQSAALALALTFIPLQRERFDLVVPAEYVHHPGVQALLAVVQHPAFRTELRALGGYDPTEAGQLWTTTQASHAPRRAP